MKKTTILLMVCLSFNIKASEKAIEIVKKLNPVQYYYNLEKDTTLPTSYQFGFLAQSLLEIEEIKHIVSTDDKGYMVDYQQIIPVNTSAIQTLIEENKTLRNDVNALIELSFWWNLIILLLIITSIKLYFKVKKLEKKD